MEKKIKINVDEDNFREVWSKEWFKLEDELKCKGINEPTSFKSRYPHIHKYLLDTLNQFRDIGRKQQEFEDKVDDLLEHFIYDKDSTFEDEVLDNSSINADNELEVEVDADAFNDDVIAFVKTEMELTKEQEKVVLQMWKDKFDWWLDNNYTDLLERKYESISDEPDWDLERKFELENE